jgi:hypothetical protein
MNALALWLRLYTVPEPAPDPGTPEAITMIDDEEITFLDDEAIEALVF